MRIQPFSYSFGALFLLCFSACNNLVEEQTGGAIVLGDSSLMVTETDSQYLQNLVMDVEPLRSEPEPPPAPGAGAATPSESSPATAAATPAAAVAPQVAGGFKIDFGDGFIVTLTGIDGKEYTQQKPKTQSGVSYAVASGDLSEADLVVEGLSDIKVRQRHQSQLSLRSGSQSLLLRSMGKFTAEWNVLSGQTQDNRTTYSLKPLKNPDYKKISASSLRTGVQKQGRSDRLSNAALNKWLQEAKKVKSAGDPPSVVLLDNVQWQISGKDRAGKNVFKTIRFEP